MNIYQMMSIIVPSLITLTGIVWSAFVDKDIKTEEGKNEEEV